MAGGEPCGTFPFTRHHNRLLCKSRGRLPTVGIINKPMAIRAMQPYIAIDVATAKGA